MLPPLDGECTVEKIAVNAVMAGAPVDSVPLLVAAVEAITDEQFNLHAINATTGSVVPALVVNGPIRDQLEIPYGTACLGGADGNAVSIGRALRLIIRNVGGHVAGTTSQSVYGNPGRVAGLVFAEWEDRSPWGTLAGAPRRRRRRRHRVRSDGHDEHRRPGQRPHAAARTDRHVDRVHRQQRLRERDHLLRGARRHQPDLGRDDRPRVPDGRRRAGRHLALRPSTDERVAGDLPPVVHRG